MAIQHKMIYTACQTCLDLEPAGKHLNCFSKQMCFYELAVFLQTFTSLYISDIQCNYWEIIFIC